MGWSFKIGTIAGTEIRVHMTFALLLVWIWFMHYQIGGALAAWEGVAFIVAVFTCVVLHEFGHIAAARLFGIKTPDITLLVIAVAGPLVNVLIAAFLVVALGGVVGLEQLVEPQDPRVSFFVRLAGVNIFLVLFNMIPAFPMDGGRVLRAILAWRLPWARATRVAATIGQGAAIAMGLAGLFYNPLLILVAIFVYLAAEAESQGAQLQEISGGVVVSDVMITAFATLQPSAKLSEAVELLLATSQSDFPVVDRDGHFEGLLTRAGLLTAMRDQGVNTPVRSVMLVDIPIIHERTPVDESLRIMQGRNAPAVAVVDNHRRLVGMMNYETIGEMLMLRTAVEDFRFGNLRR